MPKKAMITGMTGQDGYLAQHLLHLGYEVDGLIRRVALEQPGFKFYLAGSRPSL